MTRYSQLLPPSRHTQITEIHEKHFDAVFPYLLEFIQKWGITMNVKVTFIAPSRSANRQNTSEPYGTFKRMMNLKKYSMEEYNSMSAANKPQLFEVRHKAKLIKGKKT